MPRFDQDFNSATAAGIGRALPITSGSNYCWFRGSLRCFDCCE